MDNEAGSQSKGGTKALLIILIVIVLAAVLAGGWYFFVKKSADGEACNSNSKCESGLTCANKVCSSGKAGSTCENKNSCKTDFCVSGKCTEGKKGDSCSAKTDCTTGYCANSKCTEGKVADACATYKDCESGLYCKIGACTLPPDYSKYFSKITISKMKPGLPPSSSNPLTVTNTFSSASDAIEIDFTGLKPTTIGSYYVEVVNATTGELGFSTKDRMETSFNGKDTGMGTDLNGLTAGTYDLNIYFKNELIYTSQIIITI